MSMVGGRAAKVCLIGSIGVKPYIRYLSLANRNCIRESITTRIPLREELHCNVDRRVTGCVVPPRREARKTNQA